MRLEFLLQKLLVTKHVFIPKKEDRDQTNQSNLLRIYTGFIRNSAADQPNIQNCYFLSINLNHNLDTYNKH